MTTTPTPRPTWEEVINPLADSSLWPFIRQAASKLLEARLHAAGDYDSGISSSDINHTVFGVAGWLDVDRTNWSYPHKVLSALIEESEGY